MDDMDSFCQLSKDFLSMQKLDDGNLTEIATNIEKGYYSQDKLLLETIHHQTSKKFSPSAGYIASFLKCLIKKLEEKQIEVHEDMYQCYINSLEQKSTEEYFYRTYSIRNLRATIKESRNIVAHGTTGLTTWQASHGLIDYALSNDSEFRGKNVLELGAGLGLVGIITIKAKSPSAYTFTDHHLEVMEKLKENLRNNFSEDSKKLKENEFICGNTRISTEVLDWEAPVCDPIYNVIIAADIIFDTNLIPCIVDLLHDLLGTQGSIAIISSTIRDEETFNCFIKLIGLKNITVITDIEKPLNGSIIRILKLMRVEIS